MKKEKIKEHLRFNYKERIAFIVVLLVIAGLFAYPLFFNSKDERPLTIIKSEQSQERPTTKDYESEKDYKYNSYQNKTAMENVKLFEFDPNTASIDDWERLGLTERTIKTIKNYLSKGGSFKKKEDLQKIYGLHPDEFERLAPFIRIRSSVKTDAYVNSASYHLFKEDTKQYSKKEARVIDDINTVNAEALIALPGIGEKLAARIINFRDKLGGFYSINQIGETYGLPDSTFQLIKPMLKLDREVKKLNVNTATKDELKVHPYIRWNLANAIAEYRNQHGPFKSLDELKNIVLIDEETFKKISPYLSL